MRIFTEADVARHLTMAATLDAVERSFHRLAAGLIRTEPRTLLPVPGGYFAAVCAIDAGLGLGAVKTYAMVGGELRGFAITLTSLVDGTPWATIEADLVTRMRTGAGSGVAAGALARRGASRVGIIGCGRQAPFQLDAVRTAVPSIEVAVAWCRDQVRLAEFSARTGAQPARSAEEAALCDIVITATTAASPVVRGVWLRPGALVIAIGGDRHGDRELDDDVVTRASLVVCDSVATSRHEAADFWGPVGSGLLSWRDVVELQDVVTGRQAGRTSDDEIIIFKSNGLGAWDLAAAAALLEAAGPQDPSAGT